MSAIERGGWGSFDACGPELTTRHGRELRAVAWRVLAATMDGPKRAETTSREYVSEGDLPLAENYAPFKLWKASYTSET